MIRRSTLVVLVVFVIALAALLAIQRMPNSPLSPTATVLPTSTANLIAGWKSADVAKIILKSSTAQETTLTRNNDGSWTDGKSTIQGGKIEQMLSELLAARIADQMPAELSLKDMVLDVPTQALTLQAKDGHSVLVQIGSTTPTQSGYYVRVDTNQAVTVYKSTIDTILQLLQEATQPTPTPTAAVADTPTPTAQ